MKTIYRLLLTVLILLCTGFPVWAGSPVWKISKGDVRLYLGGTVHVLSQADYPLPEAFERAYRQAEKVVLETDLNQLQRPQFQQQMLKQLLLQDGQTLPNLLRPETWKAVTEFVTSRGLPVDQLTKFRPSMLVIMLTSFELQRLGQTGTGVDQFFLQQAKKDHKPLGQLESAEEQLAFLASMGKGQEDALVGQSLDDLEHLPKRMQTLKSAWRNGDNDALAKVVLVPWKKDFPKVYDELLVERNRAWLPKIEALVKTPEIEMVLVGALHLVGEDGILQQLAADGYTVESL